MSVVPSTEVAWKSVIEAFPNAVLLIDDYGSILYGNKQALTELEQKEQGLLGSSLFSLVMETSGLEAFFKSHVLSCTLKDTPKIEVQLGKENRRVLKFSSLFEKEKRVANMVVFSEIHSASNHGTIDLKPTNKKLLAKHEQLQAVFESLPFECWALDRKGRFLVQNSLSQERWGDLIDESISSLNISKEELRGWEADIIKAMSGGNAQHNTVVQEDGKNRYCRRLTLPIKKTGKIVGVLGVCVDTTEQRRLEQQLFQAQKLDAIGVTVHWDKKLDHFDHL